MSYIRCSLTGEIPETPVLNQSDNRVYEESNLKKYLNFSSADPFNHEIAIRIEDMVKITGTKSKETEEQYYDNYIKSLKAFNSIANKQGDFSQMGILGQIPESLAGQQNFWILEYLIEIYSRKQILNYRNSQK